MPDNTTIIIEPCIIESRIQYINARKRTRSDSGPYTPKTRQEVTESLQRLLAAEGFHDITINNVSRMTGGASKEQFAFDFKHRGTKTTERFVLRMDPPEGIVETCRGREAELLRALKNILPVPEVLCVDAEGQHLGLPGIVTAFVHGVTKPSSSSNQSVSGVGSSYGHYTEILSPQFLHYLVKLHSWSDFDPKVLPGFTLPAPNTREAALLQVNAWAQTWQHDRIDPVPLITLAELWLREHAPVCDQPCLVHCDYRIGNFMFEEPSGNITTILDWELAHFGDFHEDLAWILQKLFGSVDTKGDFLVCGLMPRDTFIAEYQRLSGRTIDPKILHYYEVLNAWKCAVMDLGSALTAAKNRNNHQDLLITWLGSAGAVFLDQIQKLIKGYHYDS